MKRLILFAAMLLFSAGLSAQNQFYNFQGRKIFLTERSDLFVGKLKAKTASRAKVVSILKVAEQNVSTFTDQLVWISEKLPQNRIAEINSSSAFSFFGPAYNTDKGDLFVAIPKITFKLKDSAALTKVLSSNADKMVLDKKLSEDQFSFDCLLTTPAEVIDLANSLSFSLLEII